MHAVDARTEPRDLLYRLDAVARLAEAQLVGTTGGDRSAVAIRNFLEPGALWWALNPVSAAGLATDEHAGTQGAVVLIDEIDKADASVPNGLLDALGHRGFNVPGYGRVAADSTQPAPLIVITTNEERDLPRAFLRRCLVHHLQLPEDEGGLRSLLYARARAHFPQVGDPLLQEAATLLWRDRVAMSKVRRAPPGLAEYLDLLAAVLTQVPDSEDDQLALLREIARFALQKHPAELSR